MKIDEFGEKGCFNNTEESSPGRMCPSVCFFKSSQRFLKTAFNVQALYVFFRFILKYCMSFEVVTSGILKFYLSNI